MISLQTLSCGRLSSLRDLQLLSDCQNLRRLDVGFTRVESLAPLRALHALAVLDLEHMQVNDTTPLRGLRSLASLDLSATAVTDLSPLQDLPALSCLGLVEAELAEPGAIGKPATGCRGPA